MSSYIDSDARPGYGRPDDEPHSWVEFTRRRLDWLYAGQDRTALAATDLAAWNRLGAGRDAA